MKRLLAVALLVTAVAFVALSAHPAVASNCPPPGGCLPSPNSIGIPTVSLGSGSAKIVNILGIFAGILSVIFLTLGGIRYITSSGDPGRIASAKNTLLYSVIGLIISILAPVLIGFVITKT